MKLSFLHIFVDDFKSFAGKHQLPFDAFRPGLHFVGGNNKVEPRLGANGAGKSALMVDAITWCLFGRTPSALRNPDIKPWQKGGKTSVALLVDIDGERMTFMRTASPNAFTVDGKAASDEAFAELTGLNYDLFCNTIVLGQGQPLFFDLPPRGKMQLFVDVLQLDKWDARSESANTRVREIEREHAQADGELMGLAGQRRQTDDLLKTATMQAAEWDALQKKWLVEAETGLVEATKRHASVKAKADKADLAAESAGLDLKHLREEIDKHNLVIANTRAEMAKLQERRRGLDAAASQLEKELTAFGDTDTCPICGETIREGSKIDKHKREMRKRIDKIDDDIDAIDLAPFEKKIATAHTAKEKLRADLEKREQRMHAAEAEQKLYAPMVAAEAARITTCERDIARLTRETNPHQEQVSKLTRERTKLIDRDKELREELELLARAIERNKFWVKGFKDIRLLVIEEVLQELELTCNAMLAEVGLVDWRISYAIERETKAGTTSRGLNVSILSPKSRDAVKWESWSGGEGQRLRMVGALALSEVLLDHAGIQPDFEVLDEPTRHLSAEGVRDLCDFLAVRAEQLERRTMYIDHMAVESAQFASTTTIEKDADGSHILRTARSA
jgi:DNA repair exonuclease SbcCD ATPase subunit